MMKVCGKKLLKVQVLAIQYTCYVSRKTMRKKMSNLHQILKKAENPIPTRQTSFSIFQEMIPISASVLRIITLFRIKSDSVKLLLVVRVQSWLKKLKCKLSREEFEKRKVSKLESVKARQLHPLHSNA